MRRANGFIVGDTYHLVSSDNFLGRRGGMNSIVKRDRKF